MMIAPLLSYCCLVKIPLSQTRTSSLQSLEDRASSIVYKKANNKKVVSIIHERYTKSCLTVHKCLKNETCSPMRNYFEINEHNIHTRNQNCLLKLPKLKLELGRQTFSYSGAKVYNDLPTIFQESPENTCFSANLAFKINKVTLFNLKAKYILINFK